MKPIYKPSGKALEYGDYCINIYTGCNHGCTYCFAPSVLHKTREEFEDVKHRKGLLEALKKQLESGVYAGALIHLCFTCDPYPAPPVDTSITRDVIKAIKAAGAHVQILTKGGYRATQDLDLLDKDDWFGITLTADPDETQFIEPNAAQWSERYHMLRLAHHARVKTWISFEPVYDPEMVIAILKKETCVDMYRIGKLNYHPSSIEWGGFGRLCEEICKLRGLNYMIKDGLRKEMEATT